jgi:hypothetical protein
VQPHDICNELEVVSTLVVDSNLPEKRLNKWLDVINCLQSVDSKAVSNQSILPKRTTSELLLDSIEYSSGELNILIGIFLRTILSCFGVVEVSSQLSQDLVVIYDCYQLESDTCQSVIDIEVAVSIESSEQKEDTFWSSRWSDARDIEDDTINHRIVEDLPESQLYQEDNVIYEEDFLHVIMQNRTSTEIETEDFGDASKSSVRVSTCSVLSWTTSTILNMVLGVSIILSTLRSSCQLVAKGNYARYLYRKYSLPVIEEWELGIWDVSLLYSPELHKGIRLEDLEGLLGWGNHRVVKPLSYKRVLRGVHLSSDDKRRLDVLESKFFKAHTSLFMSIQEVSPEVHISYEQSLSFRRWDNRYIKIANNYEQKWRAINELDEFLESHGLPAKSPELRYARDRRYRRRDVLNALSIREQAINAEYVRMLNKSKSMCASLWQCYKKTVETRVLALDTDNLSIESIVSSRGWLLQYNAEFRERYQEAYGLLERVLADYRAWLSSDRQRAIITSDWSVVFSSKFVPGQENVVESIQNAKEEIKIIEKKTAAVLRS